MKRTHSQEEPCLAEGLCVLEIGVEGRDDEARVHGHESANPAQRNGGLALDYDPLIQNPVDDINSCGAASRCRIHDCLWTFSHLVGVLFVTPPDPSQENGHYEFDYIPASTSAGGTMELAKPNNKHSRVQCTGANRESPRRLWRLRVVSREASVTTETD